MTELQLYKFINDNNIEWHYNTSSKEKELLAFVNIYDIKEFNEMLGANILDENGIECVMKDGYFVFFMIPICEYFGIEYDNIFEGNNSDEN